MTAPAEPRRRGRPPLIVGERSRPSTMGLRCTPSQRERWQAAADADRRTLADWIRIALDDAAGAALGRRDG